MASGFGDRLRQAREAQKMSIDEVAARLRLKPAIVQALEEDRYQHLPSAAYARGYLRGYARLMRLDAEGFVHKQLEDGGALIHPLSGLVTQKIVGGEWAFKIAGYLIVVALGLWMVSWWQARWNDGMDKTISLESLSTDGSAALGIDGSKLGTEKIAASKKTKVSEGSKTQTVDKFSPREVVGTQREQSPPANVKPPPRRIEIQPMKQAWIEITDAAKKSLFYGLAKPGEAILISGEQPFKLVLGNASEVRLRYDSKRVEINQFMHKGVARFTLDEKGARP